MSASKVWDLVVEAVGDQFDEGLLERGERATGHALELHVRNLAGEDTTELESAVASSFANLRAQGANELVSAIRVGIRKSIQQALLAAFGAIHPVAAVLSGSIGAALATLDSDPEPPT